MISHQVKSINTKHHIVSNLKQHHHRHLNQRVWSR